GRTARARHAVLTHTAGTAGDSAAFSDMLRTHRAIEVTDLVEFTELLAACQAARRPRGRRLGVITSSGGLAELILDVAVANDLDVPPLSPDLQAEMHRLAGYITGDGNPLDAWGNGTFVPNLDHALAALQSSPDHDAVVFLRDNGDGQPMDQPETALNYLQQFARAGAATGKPHYRRHARGPDRSGACRPPARGRHPDRHRHPRGTRRDRQAGALGRLETQLAVTGGGRGRTRGAL